MRHVPLLLAFTWSVAVSLYLLNVPVYSSMSTSATIPITGTNSSVGPITSRSTLMDINGAGILLILAMPTVVALIPLLMPATVRRRTAAIAGVLVGVFSFLGAMTVGLFYLPTALLLLVGAALPERIQARAA